MPERVSGGAGGGGSSNLSHNKVLVVKSVLSQKPFYCNGKKISKKQKIKKEITIKSNI